MDKLAVFIESAYEALRAQRAEEAVKEVAWKLELAERDALLVADMRYFVEANLPAELHLAVKYPEGAEVLQGYPHVNIEVEGCVPVILGLRYHAKTQEFFMENEIPFSIPALEIYRPGEDDSELFEGRANFTWYRISGNYQRINCGDAKTAMGLARERWLVLAEAEAENKRLFDELTVKQHEKTMAQMRELYKLGAEKVVAVAEYVPVVDEVSPAHVFNQALREYVYDIVADALKRGAL